MTFLLILGSFVCFVSVLFSCQEIDFLTYIGVSVLDPFEPGYVPANVPQTQLHSQWHRTKVWKACVEDFTPSSYCRVKFLLKISHMGNKESFGSSEWHLEGHGFCHAQVVARLELVQCFFYTETGLREKCNLSSRDLVSTNLNAHSSPRRKIWFYRQFLPGLSKSKISSRHQH